MKIKLIFTFLLFAAAVTFAQNYPLVTIQDIQNVPDSLMGTDPPSPLNGDTVRVQGVVMVTPVIDPDTNRRDIISAGSRWVTYIQDPEGNLYGGLNILQEDTTATGQGTFFDLVDTAQVVEFTGKITEFNTTTEMILITSPQPIPVQIIEQKSKRPDPIELTLADLFTSGGTYNFDAEKYENMYVIFRDVITSDRNTNGNFKINDNNGHFAFIYNQSRYFKTGTAGIIQGYAPPLDGSNLSYLRGVVTSRTDGYYIVPVYPGDVGDAITSPPIISTVRRDPVLVGPNQPVTISAKIIDLDGTVVNAKLFYSVNGSGRDSLDMSSADSIYTTTIPGVPDSALVDFYITSTDNQGFLGFTPSDTVRSNYFYLVLNRPITINDVQYSPFGGGFSGYHNYRVSLTGTITADTSGFAGRAGNASNRIIMQNGEGPWSGIWLNALNNSSGADVYNLRLGDNVTINGLITEDFNVTKMDSITNITVNSSNNSLPQPQMLQTGDIDTKGNDVVDAEKWESVLVGFNNITVTDVNADGPPNNFGEISINDGSGNVRVELQDGNHFYHNLWDSSLVSNPNFIEIKENSKFDTLKGIIYFSFGNYKLVPRLNSDFVGYTVVGIKDKNNYKPSAYKLDQNYPNPFNPSTTISYSIPKEGIVTLKIYNVLGQEVKTLINKFQPSGNYTINFEASKLTSGVYFYAINAGDYNQVKKMILLK
ncbi:MAG: T9SS type A sorting domain-containing protein [Ignavibacteriaceae bacterium]